MRLGPERLLLAGLALLAVSCEPASVTDARKQLGGNHTDTLHFAIPLTQDSFRIADFLSKADTSTTSSGVVGVKLDAESVKVNVGQQLKFNNISFTNFTFGYNASALVTQQASTGTVTFPAPRFVGAPVVGQAAAAFVAPTVHFSNTTNGASVQAMTIGSGQVDVVIVNNSACSGTLTLGLKDSTGATVVTLPTSAASYNLTPGLTVNDTSSLAGKTFVGFVSLNPTFVPGGLCAPASGSISTNATFQPLTLSSVKLKGVNESSGTKNYSPLAGEARIQAVDTVGVASGGFTVTAQNNLPLALSFSVTLQGVTKGGVPVSGVLNVAKAPTGGSTSGSLNFDLTGATIIPANVVAQVSGVATTGAAPNDTATITAAALASGVSVSGTGNLVIQSFSGKLDPTKTPELTVAVQNSQEMPSTSVDFGDFGDAVKDSGTHINDAVASLTVRNTAATPLSLVGFTLGAVQLDAAGNLKTKTGGGLDYELDTGGQPILINVADPGKTTLSIARSATTAVSLQAAPLIDRVVHLILNNKRVAIVAAGSAQAGDGAQSRIVSTDNVAVTFALTVGLDFTLPASGVSFTRNQTQDGADLAASDANDIAARILNGGVAASVTNGTPFGLTVNVAFVDGIKDSTVDIFNTPGHVTLDSVTLAASAVDGQGRVTTPAADSVNLTMSGAQARPLLGRNFTVGVRIRLTPPAGGRGAIRPSDQVRIFVRALLDVQGGGQ